MCENGSEILIKISSSVGTLPSSCCVNFYFVICKIVVYKLDLISPCGYHSIIMFLAIVLTTGHTTTCFLPLPFKVMIIVIIIILLLTLLIMMIFCWHILEIYCAPL